MEKEYREAMVRAKGVFDEISQELPEEAQYVVPMAYNIHWYFHINLRALQWIPRNENLAGKMLGS